VLEGEKVANGQATAVLYHFKKSASQNNPFETEQA